MLRSNLATRPFYNERATHVVLGLAGAIILLITILNVTRIITLSQHNTELSGRVNADRAEAQRLTGEAARIRRTINKDELDLVVGAAQEANILIDQRTFSWTEFFNQIEATIPPDVMLTSVRPSFKDGITHVMMIVVGRQEADITEFMEKLEATGSFDKIFVASAELTDDGVRRATIESEYSTNTGEAPVAAPHAAAAPASGVSGGGQPSPAPAPSPTPAPPRDRGRQ